MELLSGVDLLILVLKDNGALSLVKGKAESALFVRLDEHSFDLIEGKRN